MYTLAVPTLHRELKPNTVTYKARSAFPKIHFERSQLKQFAQLDPRNEPLLNDEPSCDAVPDSMSGTLLLSIDEKDVGEGFDDTVSQAELLH